MFFHQLHCIKPMSFLINKNSVVNLHSPTLFIIQPEVKINFFFFVGHNPKNDNFRDIISV